jgi:hypothetical protein
LSAGLPAEVRDLLGAVVEALDIPMPDITDAAGREHRAVLVRRTTEVRIVLQVLLDAKAADLTALTHDAGVIRARTAAAPVGYPVWQDRVPACGRCRQPFDPADARFDGHAQHGTTPFCRGCVDRCHESTDAFHVCPVCDESRRGGEGQ